MIQMKMHKQFKVSNTVLTLHLTADTVEEPHYDEAGVEATLYGLSGRLTVARVHNG